MIFAEILPPDIRSSAYPIGISFTWLVNFLLTLAFHSMILDIGYYGTFWLEFINKFTLLRSSVFPKVRSADHFWSAKLSNLIRKTKNLQHFAKNHYFKQTIVKIVNFYDYKYLFHGHQNCFIIFCGPPICFYFFIVFKL